MARRRSGLRALRVLAHLVEHGVVVEVLRYAKGAPLRMTPKVRSDEGSMGQAMFGIGRGVPEAHGRETRLGNRKA